MDTLEQQCFRICVKHRANRSVYRSDIGTRKRARTRLFQVLGFAPLWTVYISMKGQTGGKEKSRFPVSGERGRARVVLWAC